jgi:4-carboxymuconolactone decarboxylase
MHSGDAEGLKVFAELLGEDRAEGLKAASEGGFGARFAQQAIRFVFAEVWGNAPLPRRDLSLLTIGGLVATRQTSELANHVAIALRNGLTPDEIEHAITHMAAYSGFPAVARALAVAGKVFQEPGVDHTS